MNHRSAIFTRSFSSICLNKSNYRRCQGKDANLILVPLWDFKTSHENEVIFPRVRVLSKIALSSTGGVGSRRRRKEMNDLYWFLLLRNFGISWSFSPHLFKLNLSKLHHIAWPFSYFPVPVKFMFITNDIWFQACRCNIWGWPTTFSQPQYICSFTQIPLL